MLPMDAATAQCFADRRIGRIRGAGERADFRATTHSDAAHFGQRIIHAAHFDSET